MKKRIRIYFLILVAIGALGFVWVRINSSNSGHTSNRLIAIVLEGKVKYYDFMDSLQKDVFKKNYENTISLISGIQGEIEVVGERTKVSNDSFVIQIFILFKRNSEEYVSLINNVNGTIKTIEYQEKISYPSLPIYCDAHYFYLAKSKFPMSQHDSYSLFTNNKRFIVAKIFLSKKFDDFNNVICPCDDAEAANIIEYVDKQFDKVETLK